MEAELLKQKILNGQVSTDELSRILSKRPHHTGNLIKSVLKGVKEGYTYPRIWKAGLDSVVILLIVLSSVVLTYAGILESIATAIILAFTLGFIFGKIR